jgi:hypothetical protein
MNDHCTCDFFALERGERDFNLHLQGVISTHRYQTPTAVTRSLKSHLGFAAHQPFVGQGNVRSVALANSRLHTFVGMLGYCMKDQGRPWFRSVALGIDDVAV